MTIFVVVQHKSVDEGWLRRMFYTLVRNREAMDMQPIDVQVVGALPGDQRQGNT